MRTLPLTRRAGMACGWFGVAMLLVSPVWSLAADQVTNMDGTLSVTLQDIVRATAPLPAATIYAANEIVTLDPGKPSATAVAVVGDRILFGSYYAASLRAEPSR